MSKSILSFIGREEASRMLRNAVTKAAAENKAAGVTTASYIDGRVVITPGKPTETHQPPDQRPDVKA